MRRRESSDIPRPPVALAYRVGCPRSSRRPLDLYESRGNDVRAAIESFLPAGWSFDGRRVLDFGCGAGRVLRHFLPEASSADLWGCDIHQPSIRWLQDHLCPPLHAYQSGEAPPLPHADGHFDLIWALSVFPHITEGWSDWLVELHRVLADDGLLLVTFMGEGVVEALTGESWDEDRIGMNVVVHRQSWDRGGPMVLHSPWWIRAHWGRAFEIVRLAPHGFAREGPIGQGAVLLRKKAVEVTAHDLERWELDPREADALRHNLRQAQWRIDQLEQSRSWRFTQPLRHLASGWDSLRSRRRPPT